MKYREEWKYIIIDDVEWGYEVSNHGKVRNSKTKRIIKPFVCDNGYLQVGLHKDGKQKTCYIHRLVALAFIPNPENKPTVNHLNENKTLNTVENLEWATHKEQNIYGTRTERMLKKRQEKGCSGKPVYYIENGVAIVYPSAKSAELDGFKHDGICKCCKGKQESHKGKKWKYVY